jgi:hypothetical protein
MFDINDKVNVPSMSVTGKIIGTRKNAEGSVDYNVGYTPGNAIEGKEYTTWWPASYLEKSDG